VASFKKYKERKARGVCVECETPTQGTTKCDVCAIHARTMAKKRRASRIAAGNCFNCGKRKAKSVGGKCQTCIDKTSKQSQKIRSRRKKDNLCTSCGGSNPVNTKCQQCIDKTKDLRESRKQAVFDYYGRVCNCCGEDFELFLQIDHVNNDGYEHRKEIGPDIYRWLVANGFPDEGFQVLCANCNFAKKYTGHCPCQQRNE
jgi:hypothetical protein